MEYDTINEMLRRYNAGELDLTDEEAELLAMNAQRFGSEFKSRSKPLRKGAFDFMDMATFGLLPNQWRPTSQAQDITGETGLDRFAGGVGSVAGLVTGIGGAVKGLGMAGRAITARGGIKGAVAAAKEAQAVKRANAYAKSLYNKGENIVGAGAGRVADYTSRAAEFASQSPGLQTAGNVARGIGGSAAALGRAGYGRLPGGIRERTSPVLRRIQELLRNPAGLTIPGAQGLESLNPYSYMQPRNPLSFGRQKGGYIPGYQEGGKFGEKTYYDPDAEQTDEMLELKRLNRIGETQYATPRPGAEAYYDMGRINYTPDDTEKVPGAMGWLQRVLPGGETGREGRKMTNEEKEEVYNASRYGDDLPESNPYYGGGKSPLETWNAPNRRYSSEGYQRGGYVKGR